MMPIEIEAFKAMYRITFRKDELKDRIYIYGMVNTPHHATMLTEEDKQHLLTLFTRYQTRIKNQIGNELYTSIHAKLTKNSKSNQLEINDIPGKQKSLFS